MSTRNLTSALAFLAVISLPAGAADSGVYVGVGSGQAELHEESANPNGPGTVAFTARNPLYRGFLGYRASAPRSPCRFSTSPPKWVTSTTVARRRRCKARTRRSTCTVSSPRAICSFPSGPLDLFAKAGVLSWDSYKNIGGTSTDRSGSNALYGGGVWPPHWQDRLSQRIRARRRDRPEARRDLFDERGHPVLGYTLLMATTSTHSIGPAAAEEARRPRCGPARTPTAPPCCRSSRCARGARRAPCRRRTP